MAEKIWATKDPDEVKDYQFDWSQILVGDTILTSTWDTVSGDVVATNKSNTTTTTTFWATGGTDKTTSQMHNRIVTTGGRTYDRTRPLKVRSL